MTAEFKVIKIDPHGSGMDYNGHLGKTVTDAKRCCQNCCVIFGTVGCYPEVGPFVPGELEPINEEANQIMIDLQNRM